MRNANYYKIDPRLERQELEGWGTSIGWWGNVIGTWKNSDKVEEVLDLIFSQSKGLGMNIVRYNLGGGEKPQNVKNLRVGADVPTYLPSKNNWKWNNDEGQRKVLLKARDRGVNIFEAFANTPPDWMTISGSTAGSVDGLGNLCKYMYDDFANYLVEIVEHFSSIYRINFKTLSPFNEPTSFWWKSDNNQEGCHFNIEEQIKLLEKLGEILDSKGMLGTTSISAPEGWSTYESIFSYNNYNEKIKEYISQINTHSYFSDGKSRKEIKNIAKKDNKRLWMSEVSCGGINEHNHDDMSSSLELATNIVNHINEMEATAWVYWQAIEDEAGKHNHGLIHASFTGTEEYWVTKQYYAFANFSKFIKKGAKILDSSIPNSIVAVNADQKELVIVLVNGERGDIDLTIDLSMFKGISSNVAIYKTSDTENLKRENNLILINNELKYKLEGDSIATLVIGI